MAADTGKPRQKIISVDVVKNERLRSSFKAKQKELEVKGKGESLLLFHGTPQANILSILKNIMVIQAMPERKYFFVGCAP